RAAVGQTNINAAHSGKFQRIIWPRTGGREQAIPDVHVLLSKSVKLERMKYALVAGALIGALLNGQEQGRDLKLSADPATLQQRGRLWAVVIGVSSYANIPPESQLRF